MELLRGGIKRLVSYIINGAISGTLVFLGSKVLALAAVQASPELAGIVIGLIEQLQNPAFAASLITTITIALQAILGGLFKSLRDSGKIPGWIPL